MTVGDALGLRVSVDGDEAAVRSFNSVGDAIGRAASKGSLLGSIVRGIAAVTSEARVLKDSLAAAGSDQSMQIQLAAVTKSASMAAQQIAMIRSETSKGIFDKSDLFDAVKLLDLTHASLSRFLPLTEELAARSGKSLSAVAQYVSELAGGATARLQGLLKPAGITVKDLRGAGLDVNAHYQTHAPADRIIAALEKITGRTNLTGALGGGFEATTKGLGAAFTDLQRSLGGGLIPILQPLEIGAIGLLKRITSVNDRLDGWPGILLTVGVGLRTVSGLLGFFRRSVTVTQPPLARLTTAADLAAIALERLAVAADGVGIGGAAGGAARGIVPYAGGAAAGAAAAGGAVAGGAAVASKAYTAGLWIGRLRGFFGLMTQVFVAFGKFAIGFGAAVTAGVIAAGQVAHMIDPKHISSPFKPIREHIEDLQDGDPDWMLQRNDARRHRSSPMALAPSQRPQRRATADAIMLARLGGAM